MNHLNQWENSIRQGLEHHEAVPPAMGWEKLEQALGAIEAAGTVSENVSDQGNSHASVSDSDTKQMKGSRFSPSWVKGAWTAAGVAAAASVAVVCLLHHPQSVAPVTALQQEEAAKPLVQPALTVDDASSSVLLTRSEHAGNPATKSDGRKKPVDSSSVADEPIALLAAVSESVSEETTVPDDNADVQTLSADGNMPVALGSSREATTSKRPSRNYAPQRMKGERQGVVEYGGQSSRKPASWLKPQFSLHMNASGSRRMNQRGTYYNPPRLPLAGNVIVMGNQHHEDFAYIVGANQDKSVQSEVHHKKPFQTGLSVSLPVSKRWSVRTGLTYTCLSSDIKAGSDVAYYVTEQNLHYVGIPVSAAYTIYDSRYLDCYASAGAMVEKCVKARRSTTFTNMEQQRTSDARSSGFADGLWQASANVSVGVQLNVTSQIGLYFEPGVSYFIPDGSSLPNIRHEHPWNFNMQGGLRLSLGK